MEEIIKCEDLSFSYRDSEGRLHHALKNVNIAFRRGEYTAVLGHNGSGKSTLAKLLNMIITAEDGELSGRITVFGKEITDKGITESDGFEVRQKIGMVHQNPDNQIVATTVEEDVAFGPENLGIPHPELRERVDSAIIEVGLEGYEKFAPHRLSGGQKQRVAIAGILAMLPECIILDEATAMLDPEGRESVLRIVRDLREKYGITVITITHYMNEATEADRVIILNEGEVFMDGKPDEIFTEVERLKSVSLDVPQVTELFYKLRRAGVDVGELPLHTNEAAEKLADIIKKHNCRIISG